MGFRVAYFLVDGYLIVTGSQTFFGFPSINDEINVAELIKDFVDARDSKSLTWSVQAWIESQWMKAWRTLNMNGFFP